MFKCLKIWLFFAAKSPIFSHISATLSGLPTIRANQAEKTLQDEFDRHQDLNTGAFYMFTGKTDPHTINCLTRTNKIST